MSFSISRAKHNVRVPSSGLPVHHQLPEFTQTHVHRVGDAIQPSPSLSSPSRCSLMSKQSCLLPPSTPPFWIESYFHLGTFLIGQIALSPVCHLPWIEGPLGTQPTRYCCNSHGLTAFPVTRYFTMLQMA